MLRKAKRITQTLSFRLSLMVVAALATLLMVALLVMLFFSRKIVKEEALRGAEQTLEATVLNIDNILLSVEQASGNAYLKIARSMHTGDGREELYARKLAETHPYISDCRLVWDSGDGSQEAVGSPLWSDPMKENNATGEAVTSFHLPLYDGMQRKGEMVVDVRLALLSKIVLDAKPSPNSFCTLLARDGSFFVHRDSTYLSKTVFDYAKENNDPRIEEAANEMLAGKSGYGEVRVKGKDYYVFYKPYRQADVIGRAMSDLGWSVGLVYPTDDVFGDYNRLLHLVLIIAVVGLALLLTFCYAFVHRQFLPLRKLAASAQRIAEGGYQESADRSLELVSRRQDEIGRLQNHFIEMQQSLSTRMGEMQRLTETLHERGRVLQATYERAQTGESMKTNFLYNMSDQIMSPVSGIRKSVDTISGRFGTLTEEDINRLVEDINRRGGKVTDLLNQLIVDSEKI